MTALLVALGGALGAAVRLLLSHRLDGELPRGTFVANLVGSLLLGLLSGLALTGRPWAFAAVGFCGALTTYSTLAVQSHGLGRTRGSAYALLTVVPAIVLCALGFWLGAQA